MGLLKRLTESLSEGPDQLRAQEIRNWCREIDNIEQIGVCRPRTHARVAGRVQSIKVNPRGSTVTLEVQIYDGTDQITGVWFGRRKIPGIDLGRGLILQGTIVRSRTDVLQLINPAYELMPSEPA